VGISQVEKKSGGFVNMASVNNDDQPIFLPLSTGVFYLRSSSKVDNIYIQAKSAEDYSKMKNRVRQLLLARHNMSHDFQFADIGSFMMKINKEIDLFMKKWSVLFITIASVSLFVGGIGLFSTLFISIAERMNEIGVRKSIGAKNFDIFLLFISEALILALIAAFMGLGLSTALMAIVSKLLSQSFTIPIQGILIGFGFSIVIGFLSGLYPAIKAAGVNPTEAIYYFQ
jgi:putative ABC transport system permease protein